VRAVRPGGGAAIAGVCARDVVLEIKVADGTAQEQALDLLPTGVELSVAALQVSRNGWLLSRRGRSLPANGSGFDTHRDSISSRFDCRRTGWRRLVRWQRRGLPRRCGAVTALRRLRRCCVAACMCMRMHAQAAADPVPPPRWMGGAGRGGEGWAAWPIRILWPAARAMRWCPALMSAAAAALPCSTAAGAVLGVPAPRGQ
jgi:hypothetical protein